MTDNALGIINLLLAGFAVIGVLYGFGYKYGRMEEKIDVLWEFVVRRGKLEAYSVGMMTKNSPWKFNEKWIKRYPDGLREAIIAFYKNHWKGKRPTEEDFFITIEKNFGERIIEEVCIPQKLDSGSCLTGAYQICLLHTKDEKQDIIKTDTTVKKAAELLAVSTSDAADKLADKLAASTAEYHKELIEAVHEIPSQIIKTGAKSDSAIKNVVHEGVDKALNGNGK